MKKYLLLLTMLFGVLSAYAQDRTVTGKVTSAETGEPLPGVNVILKGTSSGVVTDTEGNYTLSVPTDGGTLVFSFIGLKNRSIEVGSRSVVDVQMSEDVQQLSEVVVRAIGVDRSKKALGYAVNTLNADAVEQRPEPDLVRALNGKIPGVQITSTSGATGSGTNFIIRSRSSINGDNQPLYIVDGVPFDGGTGTGGAGFNDGGTTASSRFLDLDPNNIESISVLKGLSASVLYGYRGRNGVVLITTKSGSQGRAVDGKFEISVNQTVYANQIANLPEYQNTYGQGADNIFNPAFVGNWGSRFDSRDSVPHPYNASENGNFAFPDVFPQFQDAQVAYEPINNAADFFRTGVGTTTNITAGKTSENSSFNFSFGYTDEEGYVPNNDLQRVNFGLGGSMDLSNNFTVDASVLFSNTEVNTPPIGANNAADALTIFDRTLFVPRHIDLANLPFQHPVTGQSVYYRPDQDNPYWLLNNASDISDVNRTFLSSGINYRLTDKINLRYSLGFDQFNEIRERRVNQGSTENATYQQGYLRTQNRRSTITNHRIVATFSDFKLGESFGLSASVGAEARRDELVESGQSSTGQIVFDVFTHRNFTEQINADPFVGNLDLIVNENTLGVFGEVIFDYNEFLLLNLSGRNDWSSTLEPANRAIFYPSASLAWIPTAQFADFGGDNLDFLKFRAAYGTSARFPGPYNTRPILVAQANRFESADGPISTNTAQATAPNPNLEAELQQELEFGTEASFFNGRVNVDFTYFRRVNEDQIIQQDLDPSTGFTQTNVNLGTIETDGVELILDVVPVQTGNFTWRMSNIFDAYETTVTDLPVDALVFSGFTNLGNFAQNNQPLGVIKGSYAMRDDEGNLLINPIDGKILDSDDYNLPIEIIGDPNPDFKFSTINSFDYKGINLSFQVEYVHGGDIYSQTVTQLLRRGVTEANVEGREDTWVIPGVLADPNTGEALLDEGGNKIPNNIQSGANDLYFLNLVDPASQGIYDATHVRLREVSIGYSLPSRLLENTPFGSASITLAGQNLWFHAFNIPDAMNFDPEQLSTGVGNGMGLDFQTGPTTRRFSASIKFTF